MNAGDVGHGEGLRHFLRALGSHRGFQQGRDMVRSRWYIQVRKPGSTSRGGPSDRGPGPRVQLQAHCSGLPRFPLK